MQALDYLILGAYLIGALVVGILVSRRAGRSADEYFLAGRSLPWWVAGTSMVATTFAADTPLAVTGIVASGGIAGNWIWWAIGIAHVLAAIVFARWWRRLRVVTDAEIMEHRYDGVAATVLRTFKAFYASIFVNVLVMGWVILAMQKVSLALFPDANKYLVTFALMALAVVYSLLGGMRSVVITDLAQFALAMLGAVLLMGFAIGDYGSLDGLVDALYAEYPERAESFLDFVPSGDLPGLPLTLFATLLAVAWWRQAEGAGYIVQRLGATKNAQDAERAGVLFAVLHNAIRPWPWIVVALVALIVWPLDGGTCSETVACPAPYECVDAVCGLDREATYPMLMADELPMGLLGIMVVSLLAAFMSTIDTHVNWGASYIVRDLWQRFVRAEGDARVEVLVGRIAVVVMAVLAACMSLVMTNIVSVWLFIIMLGSGLGSVAIARWLWWRVNAKAELAALIASTALSLGIVIGTFYTDIPQDTRILTVAFGSLVVWVPVALLTEPTAAEHLDRFYRVVKPLRWGWGPVAARNPEVGGIEGQVLHRLVLGFIAVFGTLFGLGGLLLRDEKGVFAVAAVAGIASAILLIAAAGQESDEPA